MTQKPVLELTDQELFDEAKKMKSTSIVHAVLFGVIVGIATYSTVKNGFGILTFFLCFFYRC